jgi:hypothetical protein
MILIFFSVFCPGFFYVELKPPSLELDYGVAILVIAGYFYEKSCVDINYETVLLNETSPTLGFLESTLLDPLLLLTDESLMVAVLGQKFSF